MPGSARWLAAIGLAGLALLGFTWWLTREPAPSIRVRWRDDVSAERQVELERRYRLSNPRAPQNRSIAYDLLDTSHGNVEALVRDPEVADTQDVDRDEYEVPFDTAYGERWMWLADRTPGVRDSRVRWALIVALAAMTVAGVRRR